MDFEYFELDDGSKELPNNLLTGMLRMRYSCNPDFETRYSLVTRWYAEVDVVRALVLREVGLDKTGQPIVLGPFGRNDGLWTGVSSSIGVDGRNSKRIEKASFDAAWKSLEAVFGVSVPPKQREPIQPVINKDQLIGIWSTSLLQGMGGFSFQSITFLADGTGFFEDYNVSLMYYDEFRWDIMEDAWLTIRGVAFVELDDASRTVKSPSDFNYEKVVATTQVHHSEGSSSIEVLYLPLRNQERAWVSECYGRCPVPLPEQYQPTFS